MALFKIYFSEENIRKIKLDAVPTYQEFTSLLASLYPKLGSGEFLMKYQDEDGDKICIESQLEWEGMFQCITNDVYKLYIEQGTPVRKLPETVPLTPLSEARVPFTNISFGMFGENGSFNFEMPPNFEMPQATTFFQMFDASNAADIQTKLQSNLTECINNVFGQANNINECIKNFDLKHMETVVDDKVHEFSNVVYNKGVEVLGSERVDDLRRRKEQLIDALNTVPNHANNLYNLACAESRLGNVKESVDALDKAIRNGYQNFEQMLNDQELINIKHTQEYSDLINRIFSFAATEDIVQEPVIEEPIPEPVQEKPVDLSASILPLAGTYGYELEILKSMGFTDDTDVLLLLLEQYEGSVEQVTQFLLGFN